MDIYTLIHDDHQAAHSLIEQIDALNTAQHSRRIALFEELRQTVTNHNKAEAGSFYIALEAHPSTRDMAPRSRKEHEEVAEIMAKLSNPRMPAEKWEQEFAAFRDALLHHVAEEESDVFAAARHVISPFMATELAVAMKGLKKMRQDLLRKAG